MYGIAPVSRLDPAQVAASTQRITQQHAPQVRADEAKWDWLYALYGARPFWQRYAMQTGQRPDWTEAELSADRMKNRIREWWWLSIPAVLALAGVVWMVRRGR